MHASCRFPVTKGERCHCSVHHCFERSDNGTYLRHWTSGSLLRKQTREEGGRWEQESQTRIDAPARARPVSPASARRNSAAFARESEYAPEYRSGTVLLRRSGQRGRESHNWRWSTG